MSKHLKSEILSTAIALGIMSVIALVGSFFGSLMEQTIF
jgi:hypothetical protein